MALVLSVKLEDLLKRHTDESQIVECDVHFHKKFMQKEAKFRAVRRENGIEKQYLWSCKDCKAVLAYQSFDTADMVGGPGTLRGKDEEGLREDKEKRRHLYLVDGMLVANAQECELVLMK